MRQFIAAGNWKMNTNYTDGIALAKQVIEGSRPENVQIIFGVPATHLKAVADLADNKSVFAAAQNCHQEEKGAYTGEISAAMVKAVSAGYVILGHSERRAYFGETDELIAEKIDRALANGLKVIYCCGEELAVREADKHEVLVREQVATALFHLTAAAMQNIIVAYEPVWAIGTGVTATPAQAQEMHKFIRTLLQEKFGATVADEVSILYGGSVKPHNAKEIFVQPDVDGGLVGGASLKAKDFLAIANSF